MNEFNVTQKVARYISTVCDLSLPSEAAIKARLHLLDTVASIISGTSLKAGRQALSYIGRYGGPPQAGIPGTESSTDAVNAAFACAMAAHADETDDSHLGGRFHPGCAVIPAALAVAQHFGRDGRSLLRAIAAGYDVGARATMALGFSAPRSGTHSTHCLAANFGAAAAAGALAELDEIQCEHLLSYATQQASGVAYWERDPDHVEKAFDFGGMGARNGVFGALFVKTGASGVAGSLTGEFSYISAFAENPNPERLGEELGERYEVMAASIKKWCVGSPIQAALDSVTALIESTQFAPREIDRVRVTLPDDRFSIVNNRDMPDVCLQHLVALAIVDGGVTFSSSHDFHRMNDPGILEMRQLIETVPSRELTAAKPARQAIVEIELNDGRTLMHRTRAVLGTPDNPMNEAQVEEKALELITCALGDRNSRELVTAIRELESCPDVNDLRQLWTPGAAAQGM